MSSRALILAAVTFMLCGIAAAPAEAQNLEAGKPPSAIFSSTCSLCHKSSRGLLKTVAPGSLPGFLRQHYTTSTDMAAAMSAYVLSNGAANTAMRGDNLTKQGEESKSAPKPSANPDGKPESKPEQATREGTKDGTKGRKPVREATRPDVDGLENIPGVPEPAADENAKPTDAPKHGAKQKAAKGKPPKNEPPKVEATRETPKEDLKSDGTRPDPVPAVTPAPQAADAAPVAGPKSVADLPTGPLTIDMGTPAPVAVTAEPAGPPRVPISQ
jgi:hypothetical protein